MPAVDFPFEVNLNGEAYRARRLDGSRSYSSTYIPQITGQRVSVQLDPLNEADWGDGRGWGQNVDAAEGMLMPGPLVTSVSLPSQPGADLAQFAEQDGHIYVVGGRYAYRIPNGTDPVVQDQDLGASFVAVSVVPFTNALYVGGRTSGNVWQKTAAGAWSNTMVSGAVQRGKMATVFWSISGTPSLTLVSEQTPTAISYVAANPLLSTDWTPNPTPLTIGSYPIRSIVASRNHVYFATTGGLLDLDASGEAVNLAPEITRMVMDTNGVASLAADGWIYLNAGYTLYRVRAVGQEYAQTQDVGWSAQIPRECPMAGYVTAMTRYNHWILAAVYDGTNTWVCKARESIQGLDRVGPLVWFVSPIYLPSLKVTAIHVSGLASQNPRLWMGAYDGVNRSLCWAPFPLDSAYRDLRQARPYRFAMGFQYDHPDEAHGDDALPKYLREVVAETEVIGTGAQDVLSVAADGSTAFSQIGTLKANPRAVIQPGLVSTTLASRYILRHSATGTTTAPPIIKKLSRRVIPRPDLLEVRTYQLVIGPAVRSSGGAVDGRSIPQTRMAIAQIQKAAPVTFVDENASNLSVLVAPGSTLTEMQGTLGDDYVRRVMTVDIQVAVLSIASGRPFLIGDGTLIGDVSKVIV